MAHGYLPGAGAGAGFNCGASRPNDSGSKSFFSFLNSVSTVDLLSFSGLKIFARASFFTSPSSFAISARFRGDASTSAIVPSSETWNRNGTPDSRTNP